ncbi:serine/threonine-protein kinase [Nostoc sp. MS1]|uniref:serine/threonine-protein kinase n=1 Tax=Nostoc sp. MS1 TaxID=2764711 RepID=UPI001CC7D947|nr:serine/threonine-protein kinase [Nostoc sp. MS1]BCL38230.1 hypothetical protein NSMS1_46770 [Nostoc sp. MS1]
MARSLHQPGDVIVDPTKQPVSDRYRIVIILGEGNSSITYAAEDITQSGVTVAIKVISLQQAQDWKVVELFEREAQVLAKLQHRGIPRYLNYFHLDTASDRRFYIVQELAPGKSLAAWVEQGWRGDEATLKQIARQILAILVYLQRLYPPVIHRDIKPHNIIRHEDGSLYLVDFGAVRDTYYSTLMRGSTVVGTYGYMAPEQFLGQAVPATDLYGLGATLLYLLTHKSPAELPQNALSVDFREHIQVSDAFGEWLEKLLEPDVKDRFPTAEAALLALRQPAKPLQTTQLSPRNALIALVIGTLAAVWLGNSFKWKVLSSFGLSPRGVCDDVNVLQNYLQQGGNPNLRVKHYRFLSWRGGSQWPLLFCVSSLANAELLLKHGADPNIRESYEPILFKTVLDNSLDFMKLLLKYGASPNIRVYSESNRGRSHEEAPILHYMIYRNQPEFAELLINSNGINVNEQDSYGYTPLDLAIKFRMVKIGLMLLEKGATLNKESNPQLLREWQQELEKRKSQ